MNGPIWRKSSRSNAQANCVEVSVASDAVAVRDSKNATGPVIVLPAPSWAMFLQSRG
jgi:hypothetical protein